MGPPRLDPDQLALHVPVAGVSALASLDRVDWSATEDAYGRATKVPGLLLGLASDDPDEVSMAYNDGVISHLWHQGTVYPATPFAVPYLAALTLERDLPARFLAGGSLALIVRAAYEPKQVPPVASATLGAVCRSQALLRRATGTYEDALAEVCDRMLSIMEAWLRTDPVALADLEALLELYGHLESLSEEALSG